MVIISLFSGGDLIRFHPVMSVSLIALACMLSFEITLEFEVAKSVGR